MNDGRRLADGARTFADLQEGDWFETGPLTVTAAHIDDFARLTGDVFEIHMSDEAARAHGFESRVAHGLLVLSLVDGLKNQASVRLPAIASLGWTWRFSAPVLIGDTISARLEIANKRETRHAGRGIVFLDVTVLNQRGEIIQAGQNQLMVKSGSN